MTDAAGTVTLIARDIVILHSQFKTEIQGHGVHVPLKISGFPTVIPRRFD